MSGNENTITVETEVNASLDKVWKMWTTPSDIEKWNQASADWYCPHAENDLRVGGKFLATMSSKDSAHSFDFVGIYKDITPKSKISYLIADGRKVSVVFIPTENGVKIVETFEMENENSRELQQAGWQAILDSFKDYVEKN